MSNDHDNAKFSPADLAREAQSQADCLASAHAAFADVAKVQRLACNGTPGELKEEIIHRMSALLAHHSVVLVRLEERIGDMAMEGNVAYDRSAAAVDMMMTFTVDKGLLGQALDSVCLVSCDYEPPSPEEMEEFHFRHFQQPTTEEAGE